MATREQRDAVIAHATRIVRSGVSPFGRMVRQPARLPRLHHVTVHINQNEVSACLEFYKDVLGLKCVQTPIHETAWFEQGLHLYWGSGHYETIGGQPLPDHFALVVGDKYPTIRLRCMKLDLFLTDGTAYWGSPRCFVRDPAYNRIELMERAP